MTDDIPAHFGRSPRFPSALRRRLLVSLCIFAACAALAAAPPSPPSAHAHAELSASEPPADGLLTAPPPRVRLTFTEPIANAAGSPTIHLVDAQGRDQEIGPALVAPASETEVTADLPDLAPGTYTVSWSVRSDTDGHTLGGTFAFRVGGGQAPGAATVAVGDPRAWAVATRWLTFLGAALLAGGGVFVLLVAPGALASARLARVVALGGFAGLIATGMEPALYAGFPPGGVGDPSLRAAFDALPNAWWFRAPALLVGSGLALAWWWATQARRSFAGAGAVALASAGLLALLGLSLTGHGAGRDSWRWLAVGSDILHQWTIAVWTGGLVSLLVVGPIQLGAGPGRVGGRALLGLGRRPGSAPLDRFSRLALPLVVAGVATGVLNAVLVLPSVLRLLDSTYGRVLTAKVVVLLPVLVLATFHRTRLRTFSAEFSAMLRPTLRVEAILAIGIILGGSLLALLAPPQKVESTAGGAAGNGAAPDVIDLAAPIDPALGDTGPALHLRVDPILPGANGVEVFLAAPAQPPEAATRIPFAAGAQVAVSFTSLSHPVAPVTALASPDPTGGFRVEGLKLSLDGWWRIEVLLRQGREPEIRRDFTFLLPDPNVHGTDAVRLPESDAVARAAFERGIEGIAGLHRLRYTQRLGDGSGNVALIEFAVTDGTDGGPPARSQSTARVAIVTIGEREWLQRSDGAWTERAAGPIAPPSDLVRTYAGATGFALGPVERIGDEDAEIVSFYVPASRTQSAGWFLWWVGADSGHVLRETMVARAHYMLTDYRDFDTSIVITPPVAAGPAATPVAVGSPEAAATPATPPGTPIATAIP